MSNIPKCPPTTWRTVNATCAPSVANAMFPQETRPFEDQTEEKGMITIQTTDRQQGASSAVVEVKQGAWAGHSCVFPCCFVIAAVPLGKD